jgi:hypothetical protein
MCQLWYVKAGEHRRVGPALELALLRVAVRRAVLVVEIHAEAQEDQRRRYGGAHGIISGTSDAQRRPWRTTPQSSFSVLPAGILPAKYAAWI